MNTSSVIASLGLCLGLASSGMAAMAVNLPETASYEAPNAPFSFSLNATLDTGGATQQSTGYVLSFYITGPDKNVTFQGATSGDIVLGTGDGFAYNWMDPYTIGTDGSQVLFYGTHSPSSPVTLTDGEKIMTLDLVAAPGTFGDYQIHFFTTVDGNGMESAIWDQTFATIPDVTYSDATISFVPEPGSVGIAMLTTSSGLLIRRRKPR